MPITGLPSDSATHPRQLLECERSTPTGRPSGDRGWFRTELQLRPQDGKPRYAVRSPTSSVAPALSRPLSEGSDTMTTISAKSDVMTLINMFTVEPANQGRLVELLTEATEVSVRRAPGFVSASLHRSTDGTKVTMYAQWRSIDDYQAMRQDPAPLPFLQEALTIAKFKPGVYEAVRTFPPAGEPDCSDSVFVRFPATSGPSQLRSGTRNDAERCGDFFEMTPETE